MYKRQVKVFHKLEQSHLLEPLTLPKEETNRPLAYAHLRGVKIGLGLDIDVVLPEYQSEPDNKDLIKVQVCLLYTSRCV